MTTLNQPDFSQFENWNINLCREGFFPAFYIFILNLQDSHNMTLLWLPPIKDTHALLDCMCMLDFINTSKIMDTWVEWGESNHGNDHAILKRCQNYSWLTAVDYQIISCHQSLTELILLGSWSRKATSSNLSCSIPDIYFE